MSDSRYGIKYTAKSKSWLQVLHAISKFQSDDIPEVRMDKKYPWTTVFEVANTLDIAENHASNVMKLLVRWRFVRRWKGKSTGGRPPFNYRVSAKGCERLARADKELGEEWWLLPETRSEEERGFYGPTENYESKRSTKLHELTEYAKLRARTKIKQREYHRLRAEMYEY